MCGVFGWSYNPTLITPKARDRLLTAVTYLAVANENRGKDAWGVCYPHNNSIHMKKEPKPITEGSFTPSDFIDFPLVAAHTRAATTGRTSHKDTAHPFRFGHITGSHNGVLYNHTELDKKRKLEVDSMHIFYQLSKFGTFKDITGYGTITWFDDNDPTALNISRMNHAVIAIAGLKLPKGQGKRHQFATLYSSDKRHLLDALEIANFGFIMYEECKDGHIYQASNGILLAPDDKPVLTMSPRPTQASLYTGYEDCDWAQQPWQRNNHNGRNNHYYKGHSSTGSTFHGNVNKTSPLDPGEALLRVNKRQYGGTAYYCDNCQVTFKTWWVPHCIVCGAYTLLFKDYSQHKLLTTLDGDAIIDEILETCGYDITEPITFKKVKDEYTAAKQKSKDEEELRQLAQDLTH
jgi:predicted glutamine amidotransferase